MDTFPAQDTGEHKCKEYEIHDKCGENKDSGVQGRIDFTKATNQVRAECGHT
jgi:hypothetical protein